jgi:hypothetical protein
LIEPFPTIELDFGLFGKVLTEYAQANGHIGYSELIEVQDINYDDDDKIVTAFITIVSEPMN